ncbi:SHOCT domain-containing protein [Allokutzneria albata]
MSLAVTEYPFFELMWTMLVFFCWIIWIWLLVVIFGDLFRRPDISGWGKAGWTVVLLLLPLLGVLIYLIAQGRHMGERRAADERAAQDEFAARVRSVSAEDNAADLIAKAKRLLDEGTISEKEYQELKRKALTS